MSKLKHEISLPAAADLSAKQFHIVALNTSGKIAACTTKGQAALGVLTNDPDAAGKDASVCVAGVAEVVVGTGGVTANDKLTPAADGTVVTASATEQPCGLALETGAAGARIKVLVNLAIQEVI